MTTKPAFRSVPPAPIKKRAAEAIKLGKELGVNLDTAQQGLIRDGTGQVKGGDWAATEVVDVEPRQNGKTVAAEIRALAGVLLWHEQSITWTAHRFATALESFERMANLLDGHNQLKKVYRSALNTAIVTKDNCKIRFLARATSMGRGFSSDVLFIDEALFLNEVQAASLVPTRSAIKNGQTWYLSSAPLPESLVLQRLMKRGRAGGAPRLAYIEYSAPLGSDIYDKKAWALANPAYPSRITDEAIETELGTMAEWDFAIERLGMVDLSDRIEKSVIDWDAWEASFDPESEIDGPLALGVDVAYDGTQATIVAVGNRPDGLLHVEVIDQRPGSAWVPLRLMELHNNPNNEITTTVIDPGSRTGALEQQLAGIGFGKDGSYSLELVTARELAQASVAFCDDINDKNIRHLNDPRLSKPLRDAKTRPLAGSWTWSSSSSSSEISPVRAATLARWGHILRNPPDVEPYIGVI